MANSMASAVGAKAITIRQAIIIAGILNLAGATFIGSHVTNTIRKGIVSTDVMSDPHTALIASKMGLPVSTTHAAVGGVLGVGIARGLEAVNFRIVFQIMIY